MPIEATNIIDGSEEGMDSKCSILERKICELIAQPEFNGLSRRDVIGSLELVKLHIYHL